MLTQSRSSHSLGKLNELPRRIASRQLSSMLPNRRPPTVGVASTAMPANVAQATTTSVVLPPSFSHRRHAGPDQPAADRHERVHERRRHEKDQSPPETQDCRIWLRPSSTSPTPSRRAVRKFSCTERMYMPP